MPAKALLVGINDYAPAGPGGPDLRGCVNDVRDAAGTLTALRLVAPVPGSLRILTDSRATRANILAGLRWLLTPTAGIDRLIFYYSGHGSYMVDTTGEEADNRDETICPHDFATAGMIRDDDLRSIFSSVPPSVTLEVMLDSCHSGTGTRELAGLQMLPEDQQLTIRFVEPPVDYSFFNESNPQLPVRGLFRQGTKTTGTRAAVVVPGMNHVLWAACKDNQTAAETNIGGAQRGVFSYNFFKALRRTGINVMRRQLDSIVSAAIARMGYSQVPQLEGNATDLGQPIFREVREAAATAR